MITKVFCVLAVVTLASCGHIGGGGGGVSSISQHRDPHGSYTFKYDVQEPHSEKGHHESGDGKWSKTGSYYINDAHGNSRRVDYVADEHGFRANVESNEPGVPSGTFGDKHSSISSHVTVHHPPTIHHPEPVHHAPIVHHEPQIIHKIPIEHHPQPIEHHPPPIEHHQPIEHHPQPIEHHPQPIEHHGGY